MGKAVLLEKANATEKLLQQPRHEIIRVLSSNVYNQTEKEGTDECIITKKDMAELRN